SGAKIATWAASTSDPRALEWPTGGGRTAAAWYNAETSSFTLDLDLADGQLHQVALYAVDWDRRGRAEQIDIVDASIGMVLDTQPLKALEGGVYAVWKVTGHVRFVVTVTDGPNAVISGLFVDPAATEPPTSIVGALTSASAETSSAPALESPVLLR